MQVKYKGNMVELADGENGFKAIKELEAENKNKAVAMKVNGV